MSLTNANLKSNLKLILRDSEGSLYDSYIQTWIQSAAERINVDAPFYAKSDTIAANGTAYSWDLATEASDFMKLRQLYVASAGYRPIRLNPRGMHWIRDILANGAMPSGYPNTYAIENGTLYVDATLPAGAILTLIYWAKLPTLSLDADKLPAPLDSELWLPLLMDSAVMTAATIIPGVESVELEARAFDRYHGRGAGDIGEIGRFRDSVRDMTFLAEADPRLIVEFDISTGSNNVLRNEPLGIGGAFWDYPV